MTRTRRIRLAVASGAAVAVLAPIAWFWQDSLLPDTYSAMEHGYADTGGGHAVHSGHGRDVTTLTADPGRPADVSVTLTARRERFRLASGRAVDGFTLNGTSPGPTIRATVGQLVEVRLTGAGREGRHTGRNSQFSQPQFLELQRRQQAFSSMLAFGDTRFNLSRSGEIRYVDGLWVSGNFFDTLGTTPAIGEWCAPE